MSTILEFPTLEVPVAAEPSRALAVVSIKEAALSRFDQVEAAVRLLAEKYRDVAFDAATTKGLDAAKAARHELREQGRYAAQRARDGTKDELNSLKTTIEETADRIIAIVSPVEDGIDKQIKAREKVLEDQRLERERIRREAEEAEARRVATHRAGIATLAGYGTQSVLGKSAAQIKQMLDWIAENVPTPDEAWQEFEAEAQAALNGSIAALTTHHVAAIEREAEAARVEAQRVENARVAAELAEARRVLDEQAAEVRRQQETIESAKRAEEQERQRIAADAARQQQEAAAREHAAEAERLRALAPLPAPVAPAPERVVTVPTVFVVPGTHSAPSAPQLTINIGQIVERLGFIVSAEFLASLGFAAVVDRNSRKYPASAFARICAALAAHCTKIGEVK